MFNQNVVSFKFNHTFAKVFGLNMKIEKAK
jgi:hypothetical protein